MLIKIKNVGIKYVFVGYYYRNVGGFDEGLEMVVISVVG